MNREEEMSSAEEFRQLRDHIRGDVSKIHEKLDKLTENNHASHQCFQKQLSEIASNAKVNAVKISIVASGIAILATGIVSAGIHALGA